MGGSSHGHPVDVVQKSLIVVALFGALLLLHNYAVMGDGFDPRGLLAFGFVVLAAYTIGQLAEVIRLPHITGYLLAGLALGPSTAQALGGVLPAPFDHGILNDETIGQLDLLNTLALPLICLTAGGELDVGTIRKAIRPILGVLTGQMITLTVGTVGFFYLISGVIPALGMPGLGGMSTGAALSFGGIVAVISMATSAAATIAIIVSTRARGPMTTNIISVAVIKDVIVVIAFSAMITVTNMVVGASGGHGLGHSLVMIAVSGLAGAGLGLLLHLYLKYIGAEVLLFLVGVIFTVSYVSENLQAETALIFIAAGFVASNYSDYGDRLIHEVERLSMPVFVVFFTLAGAKLHLHDLVALAPFALALVAIRMIALYGGVGIGARLAGADPNTRKLGWLGFISQAGLSITLAEQLPDIYGPETGGALRTLVLAGVAINEIIGPALLQFSLSRAGEIPSADGEIGEVSAAEPTPQVESQQFVGWGAPLQTNSPELARLARQQEEALQEICEQVSSGPLARRQAEADEWLAGLRLDFLRLHEELATAPGQGRMLQRRAAEHIARLADCWRQRVLQRERHVQERTWNPLVLIAALDRLADDQPEQVSAPVEERSLVFRADDPPLRRWRRSLFRLWRRVRPGEREVGVRLTARYHLSGRMPLQLTALAAEVAGSELRVAAEVTELFQEISQRYDSLGSGGGSQAEELGRLSRGFDSRIAQSQARLQADTEAISNLLVELLGGAMSRIKGDLIAEGTPDLPRGARRFGHVFDDRSRGLSLLCDGFPRARETLSACYQVLALELELSALERRCDAVLDVEIGRLAARLQSDLVVPLDAVINGLSAVLEEISALAEGGCGSAELSAFIDARRPPLAGRIDQARRSSGSLLEATSSGSVIAPVREGILGLADTLSHEVRVPSRELESPHTWEHLTTATVAVLPLQRLLLTRIETSLSRSLLELSSALAERVGEIDAALEEAERISSFNLDLANAELHVRAESPLSSETRALIDEMVGGAIGRSHARLQRMLTDVLGLGEESGDTIAAQVRGELAQVRDLVLAGEGVTLQLLTRDVELRERISRQAAELNNVVARTRQSVARVSRAALGEERLRLLAHWLGLPTAEAPESELRAALAPLPAVDCPVLYRRLFSHQSAELDEILNQHSELVEAGRVILGADRVGHRRCLALVGPAGTGTSGIAREIIEDMEGVVIRAPRAPVDEETVEEWLRDAGLINVVDGLRWLFQLRPGGARPLRRFVRGVLDQGAERAWIVSVDRAVWSQASAFAPLVDAFPSLLELAPMGPTALRGALLRRHALSGYELEFRPGDELRWPVLRWQEEEEALAAQRAWFSALYRASGGVMRDALRLWLASVQVVDEGRGVLTLGPLQQPPRHRLERLPSRALLTLRMTVGQGWMSEDVHASLFGTDLDTARAWLGKLAHWGILEPDGDIWRIAPHLFTAVVQTLTERGWLR